MVDRMRRRVIELAAGLIVRDEYSGGYSTRDETTAEFGALMRGEPAPVPRRVGEAESWLEEDES
jgi:cell division transport system ATP-binding protein